MCHFIIFQIFSAISSNEFITSLCELCKESSSPRWIHTPQQKLSCKFNTNCSKIICFFIIGSPYLSYKIMMTLFRNGVVHNWKKWYFLAFLMDGNGNVTWFWPMRLKKNFAGDSWECVNFYLPLCCLSSASWWWSPNLLLPYSSREDESLGSYG